MIAKWRQALIVGFVLVATHAATARYYAHRYASGGVWTPSRAMTLDLTFQQWAEAAHGADSTMYMQVARNVAAGDGVVTMVPGTNPPQAKPFDFWGPGTPLILGGWLKLVGGQTMFTFFMFAVLAQLFAGAMSIATAALWTRSTVALSLVAFASGCCPPLQTWMYGVHLTSSEIVALPMLAVVFYVLSRAFLAWSDRRPASDDAPRALFSPIYTPRGLWQRIAPADLNSRVWLWFALAGLSIGAASLSRDPVRVLCPFIAIFLIFRTAMADRRRLMSAVALGAVLLASQQLIRLPVRIWNKIRDGRSTVCIASEGCIWRYGLWMQHDKEAWFGPAGLGFGDYLDPQAAARVNAHYLAGMPDGDSYSMAEFVRAVWRRLVDALVFKLVRLPVLWLENDMWPRSTLNSISIWCLGFYATFALFCIVQRLRRRKIPEVMYLYLLVVVAASPLIHFEFRYTFPVWNTLVLAPGLLWATLARGGWLNENLEPKSVRFERPGSSAASDAQPLAAA